tara:strand:+ start:47 stop:667 length:621 start_codon:yes stop_codon:yes gene_type:complete
MTQKKVKKEKKKKIKKPTKKKKIKSGMRSRSIQESLPRPKPRKNQVLKKITRQLSSDNVNFKKYINDCRELLETYNEKGYDLWFLDEMDKKPDGWTRECFKNDNSDSCKKCREILSNESLTDYSRRLALKKQQQGKEERMQRRMKEEKEEGYLTQKKHPKQNTLSPLRYHIIDKKIRSNAKTKKHRRKNKKKNKNKKTNKRKTKKR